jgi:hypothetical protein
MTMTDPNPARLDPPVDHLEVSIDGRRVEARRTRFPASERLIFDVFGTLVEVVRVGDGWHTSPVRPDVLRVPPPEATIPRE